jgi:hypothetical protein
VEISDVVMHLPRARLVRIIKDADEGDWVVRDVLTDVKMLVNEDDLGRKTYPPAEVVLWGMNQ